MPNHVEALLGRFISSVFDALMNQFAKRKSL